MSTAAEEMELYATVNRKFRQIFNRQEQMRTFKTYDRLEVGTKCLRSINRHLSGMILHGYTIQSPPLSSLSDLDWTRELGLRSFHSCC